MLYFKSMLFLCRHFHDFCFTSSTILSTQTFILRNIFSFLDFQIFHTQALHITFILKTYDLRHPFNSSNWSRWALQLFCNAVVIPNQLQIWYHTLKKIALKHKMIYRFWFTVIINTFNIVVIQYIPFEKIIRSCQFILHHFPNQNRHLCWNDFEPNPC